MKQLKRSAALTALLALAIGMGVLALAEGGNPADADPSIECGGNGYNLLPDDGLYSDVYTSIPGAAPGDTIDVYFYANYSDNQDDRRFEFLWDWDGATPDPPEIQLGEGTLAASETYGFLQVTVPADAAPGTHTITACYSVPTSETWYWLQTSFYVPDARECGDTSLVPDDSSTMNVYDPWGEPGDSFNINVYGIPPEDVPRQARYLWDTDLATGDTGSLLQSTVVVPNVQHSSVDTMVPVNAGPGVYNYAFCWLDPGEDIWYWLESEFLVPDHPGCGDARGGAPTLNTTSGIFLDPTSAAPGGLFQADFSQYIGFYVTLAEVLWEADVPGGDLGDMVGEGYPEDTVDAYVPGDATGGSYTVTVCWLESYEGPDTWLYTTFDFFVDGPTLTDTPTPTPSPTPTPTPTPSPTPSPTPVPGRASTTPRVTATPNTATTTASPTAAAETTVPATTPEPTPAPPDETVFDTDVIAAGVGGLRGNGEGEIVLAGVTGPVTGAYLYWHGPEGGVTTFAGPAAVGGNSTVLFNNLVINGTDLGVSSDNCWGFDESHAYKADVTALVNGNGTYALSNFTKPNVEVNGASLVVFFEDGNSANNKDVILFEGNDSNFPNQFDGFGWQVLLNGITYSGGAAQMVLHVSDGQEFDDDALLLNGSVLDPIGPIFDGLTVPANEVSRAQNDGGLWDIKTYDIEPFLTPGQNSIELATGVFEDCYSLIVAAMALPAGSAPGGPLPTAVATPSPVPATPTPTLTPLVTATASPTLIDPATLTPFPTATATPTATPVPPPSITPTLPVQTTAAPTDIPTGTAISTSQPSTAPTGTTVFQPVLGSASATATPTRTPTPTPRATGAVTVTPSPTVGAVQTAPAEEPTDDPAEVPLGGGNEGPRPQFAQSVREIGDLSSDSSVVLTNLALAGFSLMLLVLSAEIFNQTVEENDHEIQRLMKKYAAPVLAAMSGIGALWHALFNAGARGPLGKILPVVIVLGVAGLIYGFEEDGFGFNDKSLVMFLSIVLTVGILTYFYDGGQLLVAKRFGIDSVIRMFPIGIFIALLSLAVTRIDGFQPGLVYGFIAAAVITGGRSPDREHDGKIIFFPALALMALAGGAWLLLGPLRDLATDSDSWLAALPEAVAVGILVGSIEGMFLQLIPMKFMDGHKVWSWSKLAWLGLAGVTAFLFWHVLLNAEKSSWGAVGEGMPAIVIVAMAVCFTVTMVTYAYFRLRPGPPVGLA